MLIYSKISSCVRRSCGEIIHIVLLYTMKYPGSDSVKI